MSIAIINEDEIFKRIKPVSASKDYLAMYSSWFDGIVKNPKAMFVPIDDHMVHRGDAVFEALKAVNRHFYLLTEHLDRFEQSAKQISLTLPFSRTHLVEIIKETARAATRDDLGFRLYLSRGPGGFSANPYDSEKSQIYIVALAAKAPPEDWFKKGVRMKRSQVAMKEPFFAGVKSCNYLHNVLMRKEAADWKVEFTVNFDREGFMGEGSTENVMLVTSDGELVFPNLTKILKGTTMLRLRTLCEAILEDGVIHGIEERDIREEEMFSAKEILIVGTTLDVLPCVEYEGRKIGEGRPGTVAEKALRLLRQDQENPKDVTGQF